ncbi:MAG TPA: flagellar basal body L-ring protein FlgH [Verrucomicrobiae bacterium]|nr:flagellar basal body L-ring protein FlgH [Verrucomicrobiae bacterium]
MNKLSFSRSNSRLAPVVALAAGVVTAALPALADSLWSEDTAVVMFSDKRATRVGDILTIIVQESNSAAKDSNTQTSKSSGVDASISSFLFSPGASKLLTKGGQLPAMKASSKTDFTGGGAIKNSETVTAQVAVRVIDVLPNHNLVVEGSRQTSYSGESQDIVLRGVVRPDDVSANNTVFSYNVADVTIKFVSKGGVSDTQKKGWFTKAWDKLSPF